MKTNEMLRVFIGYDPRQPIAFNVLSHSIQRRASNPVSIIRLQLDQLPMKRKGLTEFTFSRYIVPYLCNYEGDALFLDADMLCLDDIYKLRELGKTQLASVSGVAVVKNQRRFEWSSLMYFNNHHCKNLTLEEIEKGDPFSLKWATSIGDLPSEWNHLVGYDKPRKDAKLVHFTGGVPCWPETKGCEYSDEWNEEAKSTMSTVLWEELMGKSVHRKMVLKSV